jgi:hypothetical protein
MNPAILAYVMTSTAPVYMTGTEAQLYRLGVEWQQRAEAKAEEARANARIAKRRGEDLARCEQARAIAEARPASVEATWSELEVLLVVGGVVAVFVGGVALGTQIK